MAESKCMDNTGKQNFFFQSDELVHNDLFI